MTRVTEDRVIYRLGKKYNEFGFHDHRNRKKLRREMNVECRLYSRLGKSTWKSMYHTV